MGAQHVDQARDVFYVAARDCVALPRCIEFVHGVRSHRLEQCVPLLVGAVVRNDERLVYQRSQEIERIVAGVTTHGRGGVEAAATGEDREPAEEPLLLRREKVVAPVDERLHRLLARQRRAIAAAKDRKALVELARKLR